MAIASAEYGIPRIALAIVRALDSDVIGQAHHPRGAAGRVTAWEMALRPSNRLRNRWVVTLLDVRPDDRVLEIGFGPGMAIAALEHAGAGHVYGLDHSAVMVKHASRRNAGAIRAGRVTLIRSGVDQIPPALAESFFDIVLAVNSLGFWGDSLERLTELRRSLSPGGRIALVAQPRCPGATADTSRDAACQLTSVLLSAGFSGTSTHTLALSPPAVCVLAFSESADSESSGTGSECGP